MRLLISALTILTLTTSTLYGQGVKKCDGAILLSTSEKIGTLTKKEITDFLLTFGEECQNNAEYSEWSNELLFFLLDKQTELTLKTIKKEEKKIEINQILKELSEPIRDTPNLKELITKIEKTKIKGQLTDEIIKRLKTADEKY